MSAKKPKAPARLTKKEIARLWVAEAIRRERTWNPRSARPAAEVLRKARAKLR